MQRSSLFRALLIFGIFARRVRRLLAVSLPIKHVQHGRGGLFRKSVRRDGYAAFVALLMTLCIVVFRNTVCPTVGPLRSRPRLCWSRSGWFAEAHGWPTFYLFSVVAAVPGCYCCWSVVCKTLEYMAAERSYLPARNTVAPAVLRAFNLLRGVAAGGGYLR